MTTLDQIAGKIIREQEFIVGPIAWNEAKKVVGIRIINPITHTVAIENGDGKEVINKLVGQYERLFGRASHEVCRDAVASIIAELPLADVPSSLAPRA